MEPFYDLGAGGAEAEREASLGEGVEATLTVVRAERLEGDSAELFSKERLGPPDESGAER